MIKRFLAFSVIAALLLSAIFVGQYRARTNTVSGFLEADEIRVGSRVGGRVGAVHVQEGQRVTKGQVLVELEPFDLLERVKEAESKVAAQQATLDRLNRGYLQEEKAQAKAHWEQLKAEQKKLVHGGRDEEKQVAEHQEEVAQALLARAKMDFDRATSLVGNRAVAQEELDRAEEQWKAATAMVALRKAERSLLEKARDEDLESIALKVQEAYEAWQLLENGYRQEDIAAAQAARDAAQCALAALRIQLEELKITSPLDGVVEAMELQPGDLVAPSAPVLSLLDDQHLWVRAYVPQNRVGIQVRQTLKVVVDSFPNEDLQGTVEFVSRQAEFTPSNVQTPDERSKLVFRIKVVVPNPDHKLLPGMSATVWLPPAETGHE